jgi:hypothetical protein
MLNLKHKSLLIIGFASITIEGRHGFDITKAFSVANTQRLERDGIQTTKYNCGRGGIRHLVSFLIAWALVCVMPTRQPFTLKSGE